MLDAIQILVLTHSQLTADRLPNVRNVVNAQLGRDLIKPTDHLLEDLADRNKKVMKSILAADTVMYTNLAPQK